MLIPFAPELPIETGVNARGPGVTDLDNGFVPSPNLINVSTAFSTFPPVLFNISVFFELSGKPISRMCDSFAWKLLSTVVIFIPNSWLGLLPLFGLGRSLRSPLYAGERGGVIRSARCLGTAALEDRKEKPNRFVGLGGSSGGSSLQDPKSVAVLPVFCLAAGCARPVLKALVTYFCRMCLSIAESTSSTSIGISGLTFCGLYVLLLATLPTFFIFSTCSTLQLSIDSDLTLETCVPSLRCRAAHRMQRKMPKFQLAQPGFFAAQSAHLSLPGTVRRRSCSMRSLRACCRFVIALAMLLRAQA